MRCFHLTRIVDMNDIKKEDAYRVGKDIAIVVDGATGFQKDIRPDGSIVPLAQITNETLSSARIWAENLAESLYKRAKTDPSCWMTILKKSMREASRKMPLVRSKFEAFETPSSPVLMMRVLHGVMEVLGSGDCGLLIKYKDGSIDSFVGSAILEEIRQKREEKIRSIFPDFNDKTKEEQAKIRFYFMKETRRNLGNFKNGYFVPHMNGTKNMHRFVGKQKVVSANQNRSLNYHQRGDIWELYAEVDKIDTLVLSSDGFVERILKNQLATAADLLEAVTDPVKITKLAADLRAVDLTSDSNPHAMAMKTVNKSVQKTGSADDATALFGFIQVKSKDAFLARQRRLPALRERD